jgi:hypothetical protein
MTQLRLVSLWLLDDCGVKSHSKIGFQGKSHMSKAFNMIRLVQHCIALEHTLQLPVKLAA